MQGKLPTCWSCHEVFNWKESVVYFFGRRSCSNCGKKQHITTHSNWKAGVMGAPLPIIPFVLNLLGMGWIPAGMITVLALIIYILLVPYQLEFTKDQQPLF